MKRPPVLPALIAIVFAATTALAAMPDPSSPAPSPHGAMGTAAVHAVSAGSMQGVGYTMSHHASMACNQCQVYNDSKCCGACFGPLWATYCADKQRCRAACEECCQPAPRCVQPACGSCRPSFHFPKPQLLRSRLRRHCSACTQSPCDCACDAEGAAAQDPQNIGDPPPPPPADATGEAAPVPSPGPAVQAPENRSARRQWRGRAG